MRWTIYRQLLFAVLAIGFTTQSTLGSDGFHVKDIAIVEREILDLFNTMLEISSSTKVITCKSSDELFLSSAIVPPMLPNIVPVSTNVPADSSPFVPPEVCVVSKEELDEIWAVLQDVGAENGGKIPEFKISPNCTKLDNIKVGIYKLKSAFKEILKHQVSSAKYEELKAAYEQKERDFQKQVDEAKKAASDAEAEKIGKLQEELQKQQTQIGEYLKQIEEKDNTINEAFVRLVVADIDRSQVDSALEIFNVNITNKSQIRRIITSVYNGSDSNFDKILPFMRRLNESDSDTKLLGYSTLHEEMKADNQMKGLNVLLLTLEVSKKKDDTNFKGLLASLTDTLKESDRNSRFDSFYAYAKSTNDLVKEMMSLYAQAAFDHNYGNIQKVLDLMGKFDKPIHKIYLLNNLLTEMQAPGLTQFGYEFTPEIFVVVYNVIQMRSISNDESSGALRDLENSVPKNFNDLMYKNLCIQSEEDGSYLYAGDTTDNNRRMPATSKSSDRYGHSFSWQVEFIDKGTKVVIKNENYGEHLYLLDNSYPREARLWRPNSLKDDPQAQFILSLEGMPAIFGIQSSKYFSENLEVTDLNGDTRGLRSRSDMHSDEFEHGLLDNQQWSMRTCRIPV